jgi:hypothetical protein
VKEAKRIRIAKRVSKEEKEVARCQANLRAISNTHAISGSETITNQDQSNNDQQQLQPVITHDDSTVISQPDSEPVSSGSESYPSASPQIESSSSSTNTISNGLGLSNSTNIQATLDTDMQSNPVEMNVVNEGQDVNKKEIEEVKEDIVEGGSVQVNEMSQDQQIYMTASHASIAVTEVSKGAAEKLLEISKAELRDAEDRLSKSRLEEADCVKQNQLEVL